MITPKKYKEALAIVKAYREQCNEHILESDKYVKEAQIPPTTPVTNIFSVRAQNAFLASPGLLTKSIYDTTLLDVSSIGISEIKRARGVGSKTLMEVQEWLEKAGLSFTK